VREEKSTGAEDVAASPTVNAASTASVNDVDSPSRAKNDNSDDQGPD
jgi:hypothetical protein